MRTSFLKNSRALALGLAVLMLSWPAQAEVTPTQAIATGKVTKLEPTTPWALDYGENRCRLARIFGPKDSPHLLFFDQTAPSAAFGLTLAGPEVGRYAKPNRTYLGINSVAKMRQLKTPGKGDVAGYGVALIVASLSLDAKATSDDDDADRAEKEMRFRSIGVDIGDAENANRVVLQRGKDVLSFETGPMKEPFEALNTCTGSMLSEWGVDPEEHRSYSPPRFTNVRSLAKKLSRSYPSEALRKGESGLFRMRVIVEPDGSVASCHLEKSTIAESLSSPACQIVLREAKFKPAVTSAGKAIRSFYETSITYRVN